MGSTTDYGLVYPEPSGKVADGATAMRLLAESVEDALNPPLLIATGGDAGAPDPFFYASGGFVGEFGWNVADGRQRGFWPGGNNSVRVVTPDPGYYLVNASVQVSRLSPWATYTVAIGTRSTSTTQNLATLAARSTINAEALTDSDVVHVNASALVRIADTTSGVVIQSRPARTGGADSSSIVMPLHAMGSCRLSIHRLAAL